MIEQEDKLQKDELTAAYLLGCHNTRKAYESRIKRYNHAVRREPYPMSRMYETAEGKYVQFEDYEALQQRLAAAEAKIPKWIPVSERLPDVGITGVYASDWVWTMHYWNGTGYQDKAKFIRTGSNCWWKDENENRVRVTHWQPLPDAPETERKGK